MSEPENVISLHGSSEIVTEFFKYSVHTILYQRCIYPPENFKREPKFGISMMVSSDEPVIAYIDNIIRQLNAWLLNKNVQKLVLVVKGTESGQTLERWAFDCAVDNAGIGNENNERSNQPSATSSSHSKTMKEITNEIQVIMRQITSCVSFLPLLSETCCFDLLVYTDKGAVVPMTWEDSDPCIIPQAAVVQLRSFDTKIHKVDLKVAYRLEDDA